VANEELVRRLKEGVEAWNTSRSNLKVKADLLDTALANLRRTPNLRPTPNPPNFGNLDRADLSDANLTRAHLGGANLIFANLTGADLRLADLNDADLRGANLSRANLHHTHFRNADLSHAVLRDAFLRRVGLIFTDLSGADLSGAYLGEAHLIGVNLTRAHLSGTNLTGALLHDSLFVDVDLTSAIGLARCWHRGPSFIDTRTLEKSGSLPLEFLRGVGLPDTLIEYLPSLFGKAIQYYSCFISYSVKDEAFAKRIHADLQNSGVRCWFAPHDLPIGEEIRSGIEDAIRLRDKFVLILSEHSIRSEWVKDEVEAAFDEELKRGQTVLFPVRLDEAVLTTTEAWAAKLRWQRNIGDFRRWKDNGAYKQSFDRVLRDLQRASTESDNHRP
jgi:uncharacterized protein YjbI with pentapeptide repeats